MKLSLTQKIVDELANNGVINPEDRGIYEYGLQQSGHMIVNIASTVAVGFCFGMFWQSIIFLLVYIPLRVYVGGFHTDTQLRCFIFSLGLISAVLLTIKLVPWTALICLGFAAFAGAIIFMLAPVADKNKPLEPEEIRVYTKRARIILFFELLSLLLLLFLNFIEISASIAVSLFALSCMLILGKIKNHLQAN